MNFPSYASTPQIITLQTLLADLRGGHYQVPRFQRPFLWSDEQRLELLRSVKEGIPIGAILTWRTHETLETYPNIGPHQIRPPKKGALRTYVLDGHQRLSTLFGALTPTENRQGAADGFASDCDWEVFFDLDAEGGGAFRLGRDRQPWWLPVSILLDGKALRQYQRNLERQWLEGITDAKERRRREEQVDRWNELADALVQAFSTYAIPVMPFLTDDLEVATRTFERINTQGTSMSEVHIVAALTWSESFDFRRRLREASKSLEDCGWGDLDEKLILQACKAALGFNAIATSNQLRAALMASPKVIDATARNLARAAKFLARRKIKGPSTLPYGHQVVLLAEAFRALGRTKLSRGLADQLARWLWATTLGEHFAGMHSSKWSRTQEHLLQLVRGETSDLPPELPSAVDPIRRFDFRSARSRALVLWMAQDRPPRRPDGKQEPRVHQLLADKGREAVPKLLTGRQLDGQREDGPENRLIVHPKHARKLRQMLLEQPDALSTEVMESHFIGAEARRALKKQDWPNFLHHRRTTLHELEQRYAEQCGLTLRS